MNVQLTITGVLGSYAKIEQDTAHYVYIPFRSAQICREGDFIQINYLNGNGFKFYHSNVASPVTADIDALITAILPYFM